MPSAPTEDPFADQLHQPLPGLGRKGSIVRKVDFLHDERIAVGAPRTICVATVPIPGHRGLEARIEFQARRDGRRVIRNVMVYAPNPDRVPDNGVTHEALRAIPLSKVHGEVQVILTRFQDSTNPRAAELVQGFLRRPRPGRAGRDQLEYIALCDRYVALRDSRAPAKLLADEMGKTPAQISKMLSRARDLGLLTREGQGRKGGSLTPLAIRLRDQQGRNS